jgi:hypothetical protein
VPCPEREGLESALMEMVDRLDYLQKLRLDDPNLGLAGASSGLCYAAQPRLAVLLLDVALMSRAAT